LIKLFNKFFCWGSAKQTHNPSWYAAKLKVNKHKPCRGLSVYHQALQI